MDRSEAEIIQRTEDEYDRINGMNYRRIVAERPLSETAADWRLELDFEGNNSYNFRIGVVVDGTNLISPAFYFDTQKVRLFLTDGDIRTIQLPTDMRRISVSADLQTGRLTAGIVGSDDMLDLSVAPAVLASSSPAVYFFGIGTAVRLLPIDNDK